MRFRITNILFLNFLLITLSVRGDEQLAVLKVGSETYSNVTVTRVSATDIYFKFDKGVANAKLKKLEPELQKHFQAEAAKAAAMEQKQKASAAQSAVQSKKVGDSAKPPTDAAGLRAEMNEVIAKVKAIVNQPVPSFPVTPGLQFSTYRPGWFHAGAIKPDFNKVDIRKTQDVNYGNHEFITSDLNPGIVFRGAEVEFNPMTKYFYENRSLPKKRLTEAEMVEINRLYRILGRDEQLLAK